MEERTHLAQQLELVERHGLASLLFCDDPWALRHRFINEQTGEVRRARCDRWICLYCGPRKIDLWRRLVAEAEPRLHVVLTRVGWTVQEASRVLTTVLQYLRRGSKGRGSLHIGARPAYPLECFSVLEEHRNFQRNGFHWHLLVNGIDYLPQPVLSDALRSSMIKSRIAEERSYIVHVKAVTNARAVGYVTKYLTKEVARDRRGIRLKEERRMVYRENEQGQIVREPPTRMVEAISHARRIRYTRGFFPDSTANLRTKLFADMENGEIALNQGDVVPDLLNEEDVQPVEKSAWTLYQVSAFSDDPQDYETQRREALEESLIRMQAGEFVYSGRHVSMWAAQRRLQQEGHEPMANRERMSRHAKKGAIYG